MAKKFGKRQSLGPTNFTKRTYRRASLAATRTAWINKLKRRLDEHLGTSKAGHWLRLEAGMARNRSGNDGGGSSGGNLRLSGRIGLRLPKGGQVEIYRPEKPARESSLVERIAAFLKQQPGVYWWKERGDSASVGKPDIMGCRNGHFFAVECKQKGGKPTSLQIAELEKILAAKGHACWADDFIEFRNWWHDWD